MADTVSRGSGTGDQRAAATDAAEAAEGAVDEQRKVDPGQKAREIEQVAHDLVREKVPVHEVVKQALHQHPRSITESPNRTFGQRAADKITQWLGSWTFIIIQSVILTVWIALNLTELIFRAWDPYPFILLNLALSFQAAYAAPIIMMSQNRQAEIEAKIAHNAYDQVADIDNMQQVQMEILEAIHEMQKSMAQSNGSESAPKQQDQSD